MSTFLNMVEMIFVENVYFLDWHFCNATGRCLRHVQMDCKFLMWIRASLAQLVEHALHKWMVMGSIPKEALLESA